MQVYLQNCMTLNCQANYYYKFIIFSLLSKFFGPVIISSKQKHQMFLHCSPIKSPLYHCLIDYYVIITEKIGLIEDAHRVTSLDKFWPILVSFPCSNSIIVNSYFNKYFLINYICYVVHFFLSKFYTFFCAKVLHFCG